MTIKKYVFKSVGKQHDNPEGFFKFLVNNEFNLCKNNAIQWCKIEGLTITISALEPQVIHFAELILLNPIETNTGYKFILS